MNQEKIKIKKVNTYIVESNNDSNIVMHSNKTAYCQKCGSKLDEDSLDRFCDDDCRRNYFAEIRRDCDGIYNSVF
jgi:hypothetical protein